MTAMLRRRGGTTQPLPVDDWCAPATEAELALLDTLRGPVLDVGCGPGRLVVALAERGTITLGVDASPAAAGRTTERGGSVLCRSVFDDLPGEGRWRTVLLFDGNVGIGGDPVRLLRRSADLLAPHGCVLVEVEPPGWTTAVSEARVEVDGPASAGPWFPWAWVSADAIDGFARMAGLAVTDWMRPERRWVARLERLAA
jgi:SAM-dependent methyltransferase